MNVLSKKRVGEGEKKGQRSGQINKEEDYLNFNYYCSGFLARVW